MEASVQRLSRRRIAAGGMVVGGLLGGILGLIIGGALGESSRALAIGGLAGAIVGAVLGALVRRWTASQLDDETAQNRKLAWFFFVASLVMLASTILDDPSNVYRYIVWTFVLSTNARRLFGKRSPDYLGAKVE